MNKDTNSYLPFDMELMISFVLRGGVFVSMAFLGTGLIWRWIATGHFQFDYALPHTNLLQFSLQTLRQVSEKAFRPRLFVNLGIITLMLTPYLRVLTSLIYFAFVERNRKYTLFTSFVLAVLTYSLLLR